MGKFLIANLASSTFFFRNFTSIAFAFFPTISLAEQTGLTSHKCRITGLLSFSLRLGIPGHLRTLLIEIDNAKNAMSQNGYLTTERNSKWSGFLFYPVIRIIQVWFSKCQLQIQYGYYWIIFEIKRILFNSEFHGVDNRSRLPDFIFTGDHEGLFQRVCWAFGRWQGMGHSMGFHGLMASKLPYVPY